MTDDQLHGTAPCVSAFSNQLDRRDLASGLWCWSPSSGCVEWIPALDATVLFPVQGKMKFAEWTKCIVSEDRARTVARLMAAAKDAHGFRLRFRARGWDGRDRWIEGNVVPQPKGQACLKAELKQGAEVRRADPRLEDGFRIAIESMIEPFSIYKAVRDKQGAIVDFEVVYFNHAGSRADDSRANEVAGGARVGRGIADLLPALRGSSLFAELCEVVRTGIPLGRRSQMTDGQPPGQESLLDIRAVKFGDGFIALWSDVTGQREIVRALKAAIDAQAAMHVELRHKDEFLATLSHELRNFLAPVKNAVYIAAGRWDEKLRVRALGVIQRQLNNVERLVADMFDVSGIAAGKLQMQLERLPLDRVLDNVEEAVRPSIERRGQVLDFPHADDLLLVDADPLRLCQALTNLILNACKYTHDGGHIVVHMSHESEVVRISVSDDGIGFDSTVGAHLFDLYRQAEGSRDGLGIGLYLVQKIMRMHGGGVEAQSDGPGRGSTFTIWLPIPQAN